MIKKVLIILIGLGLLSALGLVILVSSIEFELKQRLSLLDSPIYQLKDSILEEASSVKREHLNLFLIVNSKEALEVPAKIVELEKQERIKAPALAPCPEVKCLYLASDFQELSPSLWKTLIAIEDNRFFEHKGIDYISILRALLADIKAMKIVQGGSTLTQQLVKNLFLSSEKKISRKFKELIYARYIEKNLSKEQIILLYFNSVYWGTFQGVNIKGVKSAAVAFFDKHPSKLTHFESVILVGMLKGPSYYSPLYRPENLKKRAKVVFRKMLEMNLLDQQDEWSEQQWLEWLASVKRRNQLSSIASLSQLRPSETLSAFDMYVLLQSIDNMKLKMENSIKDRDIAIKVGLKSIKDEKKFFYYSKSERSLVEASYEEKHQVGSTLKPIIYDFYFLNELYPEDYVSTLPISLPLKSGNWSPRESHRVDDEVTIARALKESLNIPLIRLAEQVSMDKLEKYLLEYIPSLKTPLSEFPAQLLGAVELSVDDLLEIYSKVFSKYCADSREPNAIDLLLDSNETTIKRVASDAYKSHRIFGKTGTSNKAFDNWFVGSDLEDLMVVWVGVETGRSKRLVAAGSTTAFRIYQDFILYRGKRINDFACKEGI